LKYLSADGILKEITKIKTEGGIMKASIKLKTIVVLLLLIPGLTYSGYYGTQEADKNNPIISVSGDAEIWVAPDEVTIYAGVSIFATTLDSAVQAVDERTNSVLKLRKKYNIAAKHIQTDHVSIDPEHKWQTHALIGYWVRKAITITLKNPDDFDPFMEDLVSAGANVINDVSFRTLELKKYREQVRALAIKAAREKAEKLTAEIGQTVGKAILINEGNYYYGYWGYDRFWNQQRISNAQTSIQSTDYNAPEPEGSVAVGQIRVYANISVVFALE
jgi:uncharacterized protein YggE